MRWALRIAVTNSACRRLQCTARELSAFVHDIGPIVALRDTPHMDLLSKLQVKTGQGVEGVLVPESVASELPEGDGTDDGIPALLVFVVDRSVLEEHRARIVEAAKRDRLTWVSYPKSGQLGTDLNRDTLVALLEESSIQPVRQIAIDGVWSALRFRPM
jgi:hypothetical protein